MIEVRDLRKAFGTMVAVDGVSFTIRDGETFGLLGPNGAGKSTTIGMLTGVLTPDGGQVVLNGGTQPSGADGRRHRAAGPLAV
jgi:ABC-type multidrug transport system ATPase subunit